MKAYLKWLPVLMAALFALGGCRNIDKPVSPEALATFSEPIVSQDKIGLYLIRGHASNNESIHGLAPSGSIRSIWVAANDKVVAVLKKNQHVFLELDAGSNTLNYVYAKVGYGYKSITGKGGEVFYARIFPEEDRIQLVDKTAGRTMVLNSTAVSPLSAPRNNDGYRALLVNPGFVQPSLMEPATETIQPDQNNAVVRFYRKDHLEIKRPFSIWNQDGYLGNLSNGEYVSVKLKPGRHTFVGWSERHAVLTAQLEANREYAVELEATRGWTQPIVKLLPINLCSDFQRIEKWKHRLNEMAVNQNMSSTPDVYQLLENGRNYLIPSFENINQNKARKKFLPAEFGK